MSITETIKKVYEAEVMLTSEDIEFIIIEHFKQKFDAYGYSEVYQELVETVEFIDKVLDNVFA